MYPKLLDNPQYTSVVNDRHYQRLTGYINEAEERGEGRAEGVRIAQEMVSTLQHEIAGIQVSAPFGRIEYALQVVEALDSSPLLRSAS